MFMKNLSFLFTFIFLITSCTQKQLITGGTATGIGLGSYPIFKSFTGQSGTGGDIRTMAAITTLGTLMGLLLGSEIAEKSIEKDNNYSQRIMNSAFEDGLKQVWRGNNQEILITPLEKVNVSSKAHSECRRFEFRLEEQGIIKRGKGIACKDVNKNWITLASEIIS